jgi:DNA-binding response OmpR family regulator
MWSDEAMKKRILVVDDERWFTNLLGYSLETQGYYRVRQENDATHAIQAAREFGPDLVLLDVMMPHLDGSEVAARLKHDRLLRDVPVLFLTALVTEAEAGEGLCTQGGHTFLPKSVSIETLIECIEAKLHANDLVAAET